MKMPKQKVSKTITKRFKITSKGRVFKKRACTSHLNRKESTNSKLRKRHLSEVPKGLLRKIRKII
ncbi:MAG: 50S ribosomal protein L35 [bacterium]